LLLLPHSTVGFSWCDSKDFEVKSGVNGGRYVFGYESHLISLTPPSSSNQNVGIFGQIYKDIFEYTVSFFILSKLERYLPFVMKFSIFDFTPRRREGNHGEAAIIPSETEGRTLDL
jgi:hypothetical protein